MKRYIALILLFSMFATAASAQDLLVKRDGTQIRVKVLSVSKKKIKYVRFMTETPIYTLPTSDIDYIEYPAGDRDVFNTANKGVSNKGATNKVVTNENSATADQLPKWHGAVRPAVPIDAAEVALPCYEVGDIITIGEQQAMVVLTTDGGRHGTAISLDESVLRWCTLPRKELPQVGTTDYNDGRENMQAMRQFLANSTLSLEDFPAFAWCVAKGEGWYLPSVSELWQVGTIFNGGSRTAPQKRARQKFNSILKTNGGKAMDSVMFYFSSTETSNKQAAYSHFGTDKPYTNRCGKGESLYVRAFCRF